MRIGALSEVREIKRLILRHPRDAFISDDHIGDKWRPLNYLGRPDYERAVAQFDRFVELFRGVDIEIQFLPGDDRCSLDAIYVRDATVLSKNGVILCNMGKPDRQAEPSVAASYFQQLGVPIRGAITGEGKLEGGDLVWLDERTIVVGRGYRTNGEGIRQLKELLADEFDDFVVVPLPHWHGPIDVFHLMSMLSPIDHDLALVYSRLLPVPFREWLLSRGIRLLEVPDSEFASMACNVLAVAPRKCIMLAGNPETKALLEREGVQVREYDGWDISLKGGGGPTCLTLPISRE